MIKFDAKTGKYFFVAANGRTYSSASKKYVEFQFNRVMGGSVTTESASTPTVDSTAPYFSINKRFEILARNVKMVAAGLQKSLILVGSGGLGKSYTVNKVLAQCGYTDISELLATSEPGERVVRAKTFTVIKGYSTAKGLYRDLYENKDSILVFDDADAIQKDVVAVDLLKGALDSSDKRIISWKADMREDDLPRSFLFTGRVIFISNMNKEKFAQALISRATSIDLKMTEDEKIERMEAIMLQDDFMVGVPMSYKVDALNVIKKVKHQCKEISLRSLIKVTNIREMFEGEEFEETAIYTLTN